MVRDWSDPIKCHLSGSASCGPAASLLPVTTLLLLRHARTGETSLAFPTAGRRRASGQELAALHAVDPQAVGGRPMVAGAATGRQGPA